MVCPREIKVDSASICRRVQGRIGRGIGLPVYLAVHRYFLADQYSRRSRAAARVDT